LIQYGGDDDQYSYYGHVSQNDHESSYHHVNVKDGGGDDDDGDHVHSMYDRVNVLHH
jgi:hypothetical protein